MAQPMRLHQLQQWMRWIVTEPRGVEAVLEDREGEPHAELRLLDLISGDTRFSQADRLSVYANGYFLRLLDCLKDDYPTVLTRVGESQFIHLIAEYLIAHPSRTKNIGEVGLSLPEFVNDHELTAQHPYLPDLAKLERASIRAFYAGERALLDSAVLQTLSDSDWAQAVLEFDPSIAEMCTEWNVDELWSKSEAHPRREIMPFHLFIYRDLDGCSQVERMSDSDSQFAVLHRLREGMPLGRALEGLMEEDTSQVGAWFNRWVTAGWVRGIRVTKPV